MSEDKRLERIETKIDDQNEHLASIDVTLALQHESLRHHIRRTDDLQKLVLRSDRHVTMAEGVLKFTGLLAALGAIFEAARILLR